MHQEKVSFLIENALVSFGSMPISVPRKEKGKDSPRTFTIVQDFSGVTRELTGFGQKYSGLPCVTLAFRIPCARKP